MRRLPTVLFGQDGGPGGALPNLLIVGAAKCGTTSLHYYLGLHPDIHMSQPKELNFFQDPGYVQKLDRYRAFFDASRPLRGESSTIYTWHPVIPDVPARIRATLPTVKLIYLVREPVERAIASYVEELAHGAERRTVDEAFRNVDDPSNRYVAGSRYATQLELLLAFFPADDLIVVDQADLDARRRETLREIFGFLGVDEEFTTPTFDRILNARATKRRRSELGRRLRRTRLARSAARLPPRAADTLLGPLRLMLSHPVEAPPVDQRLRREMARALEDEVRRFRELTQRPFEHWSAFNSDRAGLRTPP